MNIEKDYQPSWILVNPEAQVFEEKLNTILNSTLVGKIDLLLIKNSEPANLYYIDLAYSPYRA